MTIHTRRYGATGHTYWDEHGQLDGVTTLIGEGVPKPGLVKWAATTTAGYAVDHWAELDRLTVSERIKVLHGARFADVDEASRRGKDVHALAERLAHGEEVPVPDPLAGHVEAAVRFLDEWKARTVRTETIVANRRYRYAGRMDFVAEIPELAAGRVLLDWKTGRSGIFGEAALQLSAYAHAEIYADGDDERPLAELDLDTDRAYAVWVRADGYDLHPLDIGEDTFRFFLHAATVARRCRGLSELVGYPLDRTEGAPA